MNVCVCMNTKPMSFLLFWHDVNDGNVGRWLRTKLSVRIQFRSKFDFRFWLLSLARIHTHRRRWWAAGASGTFHLVSFLTLLFIHSEYRFVPTRVATPVSRALAHRAAPCFRVQIYGDFVWCFYWIYFWVNFSWTYTTKLSKFETTSRANAAWCSNVILSWTNTDTHSSQHKCAEQPKNSITSEKEWHYSCKKHSYAMQRSSWNFISLYLLSPLLLPQWTDLLCTQRCCVCHLRLRRKMEMRHSHTPASLPGSCTNAKATHVATSNKQSFILSYFITFIHSVSQSNENSCVHWL